ncbi:MAG: hypothetical protein FWC13_06285 [Oscillospiraceae bacterium]|nr:hypothetical protein [Oscillospiraceae bacterium]
MNLWFLTEEKPKVSTLLQLLQLYCRDFGDIYWDYSAVVKIKPLFTDGVFSFTYLLENVKVDGINNVFIKTVSGSSSFFDYLLFRQEQEPADSCMDNLLMAIEETKTGDDESRNTGVYQRGSKFVHIKSFAPKVKQYMLYNDELGERKEKKPSDTSIFGTSILLTLGVEIVGKSTEGRFRPFSSVEDLIRFKSKMRKPPAGNVPIDIKQNGNVIYISGRLSKPADAGNIGHDPNIGALSMISACIRKLGWKSDIVITKHGVSQSYADRNCSNKFFHIARALGVTLDGITFSGNVALPKRYWYYERNSEKVASILLHVTAEYGGMREVYQNHAGCERGYFKTEEDGLIALPKYRSVSYTYEKKRKKKGGYKLKNGTIVENLFLPDLIICDKESKSMLVVEGKKLQTQAAGLEEIENYYGIKEDYLDKYYPDYKVTVWLSLFGRELKSLDQLSDRVLLYLDNLGKTHIDDNAPACIIDAFRKVKVYNS